MCKCYKLHVAANLVDAEGKFCNCLKSGDTQMAEYNNCNVGGEKNGFDQMCATPTTFEKQC